MPVVTGCAVEGCPGAPRWLLPMSLRDALGQRFGLEVPVCNAHRPATSVGPVDPPWFAESGVIHADYVRKLWRTELADIGDLIGPSSGDI